MAYIEREVERSVPELKIGNLLKDQEIRQIIKERTYFADRKFKFSKHDFLRYIQFENKLLRLLMLRAQSTKNLQQNDIYSIRKLFIGRINSIYNHALNRYSSDKQLWLLSFDFAKRYSERISRAKFLKALLLHPNWIDAWIEAAKYEYEWNKNPTNARLLYQRAISLNNKSISLYLSFFKMEINVIKQHLNFNVKQTEKEIEQTDRNFNWKKELNAFNKDQDQDKDKPKQDEWIERIYSQMEVPKLIFRYSMKNIEGKLKYLMIKKILLLIPTKQDLKNEEMNIDKYKYNNDDLDDKYDKIIHRFGELKKYIFEYLEKHFYFDSVIIQLLARKNLLIYSKNNSILNRSVEIAGVQVFERAILLLSMDENKNKNKNKNNKHIISIVNSLIKYLQNRMDFYIKLKAKIIAKQQVQVQVQAQDSNQLNENELYLLSLYDDVMNYLVFRLLYSFKKLMQLNASPAEIFIKWIIILTQIDKFDEALNVIKLATKQYPQSVLLWKLYSDLYCRQLSICNGKNGKNERNNYYRKSIAANMKGIKCVSSKHAELLWINMIDILIAQLTYLSMNNNDNDNNLQLIQRQVETIDKTFRRGIEECLSNNEDIKEKYLRWMVMYYCENKWKQLEILKWFQTQTIKCSPKIYKIMLDIYECILLFDVENVNMLTSSQKSNVDKIARFYEKCLNEHGKTKAQVWIWYVEFSRKYRKISDASSVYQRAMKALDCNGLQEFLQKVNIK